MNDWFVISFFFSSSFPRIVQHNRINIHLRQFTYGEQNYARFCVMNHNIDWKTITPTETTMRTNISNIFDTCGTFSCVKRV